MGKFHRGPKRVSKKPFGEKRESLGGRKTDGATRSSEGTKLFTIKEEVYRELLTKGKGKRDV